MHPDIQGNVQYATMRQDANEALLSMLLYSSLSGDITKPSDDLASILYIYDKADGKGVQRVKFFSVGEIVKDIMSKTWAQQLAAT
jgi:hypothetical protein